MPKVSDAELLRCWGEVAPGAGRVGQVAAELGLSVATVSKRVAALERRTVSGQGAGSVFDIAANLQLVHEDLRVLISECQSVGEKNAVYGKILDALKFAEGSLKTLYAVQEIHGFMEEVLAVLESFEPGTRQRVLQSLQERRALRSAFVQGAIEE